MINALVAGYLIAVARGGARAYMVAYLLVSALLLALRGVFLGARSSRAAGFGHYQDRKGRQRCSKLTAFGRALDEAVSLKGADIGAAGTAVTHAANGVHVDVHALAHFHEQFEPLQNLLA